MVEGRTHRPVIQVEQCRSCNVCLRGCPAEIIPEYRMEEDSLRGMLYRKKEKEGSARGVVSTAHCQEACPIHQDTRGYVGLIAQGKFMEAFELIREVNPLPAVCGFICHHLCEDACLRTEVDQPIPMRLLKRFVAEYERERGGNKKKPTKRRKDKILVVGSGPAGLAAANDLSLMGYGVTIVETLPVLGGMLAVGIPEFRLPRDILKMEIDAIRELGVEMKTGRPFLFEKKSNNFQKEGYRAVFLATGAHGSLRLNIPGEELQGVIPGLTFLRDLNLGKKIEIGKKIAVIGGGNVALDVARSAVRMGAEAVDIYYRRSKGLMPAIPEEVDEAIREGVRIHFFVAPTEMVGRGAGVVGMKCVKTRLAEPDETGRPKVVPIQGSDLRIYADRVITAVGQKVTASRIFQSRRDGTIPVDPETGATKIKGVFAGGDVVTGPGWAIDAIAAGKKGAQSIHRYLS
jgi:NADH-quinone oxidoreductase subunit F